MAEVGDTGVLTFENDQYAVTVSATSSQSLSVEAEQKSDGALWRGEFTSYYIEEITRKTGNFKKFSVFVKMLRSAIMEDSDSVFVSLLTYHELEVLKARKTNTAEAPQESTNNKRYLILTYVGEFDRVHYPLPLLHENSSDPEILRRTIQRLKHEMDELKAKVDLPKSEGQPFEMTGNKLVDRMLKENSGHNPQLGSFKPGRVSSHPDNRTKLIDKNELINELAMWQHKYKLLLSKYETKKDCQRETQAMRRKLDQLQLDLKEEKKCRKKTVANLMLEKVALLEEIRQVKESERQLRVRVRETESELDHFRRRTKPPLGRDLPPCRTRSREQSGSSGYVSNTNSRRPSPASGRGHRSSSCPTFGSRSTCRKPNPVQTARETGLNGQKHLDFSLKNTSPCSSLSGRSSTPPLQVSSRMKIDQRHPYRDIAGKKWEKKVERKLQQTRHVSDTEAQIGKKEHSRESSPGKLLQEVRAKLARFKTLERMGSSRDSLPQSTREIDLDETTSEDVTDTCSAGYDPTDIDARIAALRNFLQATKEM